MRDFKVKVVTLEIYIGQSRGHGTDANDSFSQYAKFHYPDSKTRRTMNSALHCVVYP